MSSLNAACRHAPILTRRDPSGLIVLQTSHALFNVPLDTDTGIESHVFSVCGRDYMPRVC